MRTAPPLLAPLFRSEGQARLLAELFFSGEPELSLTDLADHIGLPYASVHREVGRLMEAGLLADRRIGNVRLVRVNETSPLARPVRELLLVTAGPVPLLANALGAIPGIDSAFIFGSFAARMHGISGGPPNDIDLMVIGTPDPEQVYDACRDVGDAVGRPVNPTIMAWEEWSSGSGFTEHVRSNPTVLILGRSPWPSPA